MDIAPYTDDLDLASVNTHEELSAVLRLVHLRADKPSLRVLEAQSRHGPTPLSKTVVSEMLRGSRFPRKAVMLAFLQACGVHNDRLGPWLRAWERIAERTNGSHGTDLPIVEPGSGMLVFSPGAVSSRGQALAVPSPRAEQADEATPAEGDVNAATHEAETMLFRAQVSQLTAANEELRTQMEATRKVAADSERPSGRESDRIALSPPASRRELGVLLRALREEKGITIEQAAERLLCSSSKVSRMESSFRSGTLRDVRDLCDLYGVPEGDQRKHLMQLAKDSRGQGWWQSYGQDHLSTYIGLENDAVSIKEFSINFIPGLLQTPEYARGLLNINPYGFSPNRVEQLIEVRIARQRILARTNPPNFHAIIDEAALHRPVGGAMVMRNQLKHICEMSELPNVSLQVIPFKAGAYPAMDGSFTLLDFTDPVPGLLYAEGTVGLFYIERPVDIERHRREFEIIHSIALSEEDSIRLVARMIKGMGPTLT